VCEIALSKHGVLDVPSSPLSVNATDNFSISLAWGRHCHWVSRAILRHDSK
jgi:hypothetical protein